MKKFWENNKSWLRPVLITLFGLLGYDQGPALLGLEDEPEGIVVSTPAPDTPGWTVTGWFYLERTVNVNEPGRPAYSFNVLDNVGRYTVKVPGIKRPNNDQVVRALDAALAEEGGKVVILEAIGPEKPGEDEGPVDE